MIGICDTVIIRVLLIYTKCVVFFEPCHAFRYKLLSKRLAAPYKKETFEVTDIN